MELLVVVVGATENPSTERMELANTTAPKKTKFKAFRNMIALKKEEWARGVGLVWYQVLAKS